MFNSGTAWKGGGPIISDHLIKAWSWRGGGRGQVGTVNLYKWLQKRLKFSLVIIFTTQCMLSEEASVGSRKAINSTHIYLQDVKCRFPSSISMFQHCLLGGKASISLQKCCSCRSCLLARGWGWLVGCAPYKAWRVAYRACSARDTSLMNLQHFSCSPLSVQSEHLRWWGPKIGDF